MVNSLEAINAQSKSSFFTKLPLEIRLRIYAIRRQQLFRPKAEAARRYHIHRYNPRITKNQLSVPANTLVYTVCHFRPDELEEEAWLAEMARSPTHNQCLSTGQRAYHQRRVGSFVQLFLTCKKMYIESMDSFLRGVTLVFTSAMDTNTCFLERLYALEGLRSLELSLLHPSDDWWWYPATHPLTNIEMWKMLFTSIRRGAPSLRHLKVFLNSDTDIRFWRPCKQEFTRRLHGLFHVFTREFDGHGAVLQEPWILPGSLVVDLPYCGMRFTQIPSGEMIESSFPIPNNSQGPTDPQFLSREAPYNGNVLAWRADQRARQAALADRIGA